LQVSVTPGVGTALCQYDSTVGGLAHRLADSSQIGRDMSCEVSVNEDRFHQWFETVIGR